MGHTSDSNDYNLMPDDENIDIKRYLSLFISNWYWFAIALFIATTLAYGINRYSERIYTVSATILIKDDQTTNINTNVESVIPGGDLFKSRQNLKNEMGILKSYMLNYRVMKELEDFHVVYVGVGKRRIAETKLYRSSKLKVVYDSLELEPKGEGNAVNIDIISDSTFNIELGGKKSGTAKKFGERIKEQGYDFTIEKREPGTRIFTDNNVLRFKFYFTDPESLANEYRGKLSVEPIEKEASILTLSTSGYVEEQEIDYLNKLMDVYLEYGLDNKNQTADSTIGFIDRQLKKISDSLSIAENNLKNFRVNNRFIDLSREGTLLQDRMERFEIEKSTFDLQLRYYDYLSEYLSKKIAGGSIISPSVMGINDQVLIRLVNELSSLQTEREKLGLNIVNDQPSVELVDKQVNQSREALQENIRNGIAGLKLSIGESERKISSVVQEIDKLPATEKSLIRIQRNYDLNNTVYTYLLEKRAESGIAKASNIADNRTIDKASYYRAAQVKPKVKNNIVIAIMLGLILPMVGIVLIDYLNDKVIDKRDVEKKTKVPIIGYISHSDGKNEIPVIEKPGSSLAESFRSVRTAIKFFIKENDKPVIAISSTISSEGKTFISINLAAIIAMLGKKVLLIGLDLRKPRINKVFEFEDSPGMSSFLSGNCKYEDVIKQTQIKNLYYAPSGHIPPNPAELIETEEMRIFMEAAKKEFDYIIIDTPPVAIVTDALLLAPYVDLNLFIVRQRYTSRNTLELIEQLYRHGEMKNLAIIINDISLSGYYGYGMRYGYSLGYGYSYGYNYYGKGYYGRYGYSSETHGYYREE